MYIHDCIIGHPNVCVSMSVVCGAEHSTYNGGCTWSTTGRMSVEFEAEVTEKG